MNESREELVSQLRSLGQSLGKVQETLDRLGEELTGVRSEAGAQIAGIRTFLESDRLSRLAGPDPAAGADLARANDAIQKIAVGGNQEQILEIYLQEAEAHLRRAALFVKQDDGYRPFKSLGFASESLEGVLIEDSNDPVARAAAQRRIIYRGDDVGEAFPWLGEAGPEPAAAVCVPLVFQDEVPVVLYGDSDEAIVLDSLELLTHLTVLALKNNYLEWLLSEGAAAQEAAVAATPAPAPASEAPAETPPPARAEAPPPAPEAEFVEMEAYQEVPPAPPPVAAEEPALEAESPPEAPAEPSAKAEAEESDFLTDIMQAEASARPAKLTEDFPIDVESSPAPAETAEAVPAEPVPERPPTVAPEELERLHNEARRFARLLVSEIKLYNEDAVEQGRSKGDLYERLRRDIDRSRDVYEKRVHEDVAAREDHFHHELVRILARGDESLMGSGYPGRRLH